MRAHSMPPGSAFTLLEVMIVIALVAILLAIFAPAVSNAREMANRAVCAAHMHQVAAAQLLYAQDNSEWTARVRWREPAVPDDAAGDQAWAMDVVPGPHGRGKVLVGPDPVGLGLLPAGGYVPEDGHLFYCPSQTAWELQYDHPVTGWANYGSHGGSFEFYNSQNVNQNGAFNNGPALNYGPPASALAYLQPMVRISQFARRSVRVSGPNVALVADIWTEPYQPTCHLGRGINAAYSDGSAKWLSTPWQGSPSPQQFGSPCDGWLKLDQRH